MNGNKISDKNNVGLFGNWERSKKTPKNFTLLLVLCPAQPWRSCFSLSQGVWMAPGGVFMGIFYFFTAHPASSVSKSSLLPQNLLFFFAPKVHLSPSAPQRGTSREGTLFGFIRSSRKTCLEFVFEHFKSRGIIF